MPTQNTWSSIAPLRQGAYKARQRTWVRTPNYRTIPKSSLPVNPYSDWNNSASQTAMTTGSYYYPTANPSVKTYVHPIGYYYFDGVGIEQKWYAAFTAANIIAKASDMQNAVTVKNLGKISDAKVNVAVAYAEAKKTSDMIYDTAKRIDRAYRAFRRGNFREVARQLNLTPKTIHNNWLAYKYGWTPLLMDVKNGAEFFAQQHIGRPTRFSVRSTETRVFTWSRSTSSPAWGGGSYVSDNETLSVEVIARQKIECELTYPHYAALQQTGITNPALVAWELVPYSFVFDWFVQVGDWLNGLTALQGVNIVKVVDESMAETKGYTYSYPGSTRVNGSYTYVHGAYACVYKLKQYSRGSIVIDPLSTYPPRGDGLNFTKLVTSLALIRGAHRGGVSPHRI